MGKQAWAAFAAAVVVLAPAVRANVITDWDEKAVALASLAATGQREVAMVHIAMFDAVNSITPRYQPYLVRMKAKPGTSVDAAAASAAATVLKTAHPEAAKEIEEALQNYLAEVEGSGKAKADGMAFGAAIAEKICDARKKDGSDAQDPFRLTTKPGAYQPTMTMVGAVWPNMKPFALRSASQFRPGPPVALDSAEWATSFNELKDYGAKSSTKRSAQQTETARFWLMVGTPAYHPIARQLVLANKLSVIDSARLMAVYSAALTDAYMAVFDAKYHYAFWRPITAIHNAGIDGNPATDADPTWQPIADTPMHPEYPCAHCIQSGAAAGVLQTLLKPEQITRFELKSTSLPGVTHTFNTLTELTDEVANARVWAGFHYRFSAQAGTGMGMKIGEFAAQNMVLPLDRTTARRQ